ncbi:MAG: hypothetical protein ACI9GW_001528 [Halieaceae bacterium]|jgi:hypothetical protein
MNGPFSLTSHRVATLVTLVWFLSIATHALETPTSHVRNDVRIDERVPYFQLRSDRSVGDRGEEVIDVVTAIDDCGIHWIYDHADLDILHNRFGDVQFISLPESGCTDCKPIVVRWMHEPTGHLEFIVNVFRRQYIPPCEGDS